jgi:3',5'-cyclic AMP phosphodiesterase CpdA
LAALVDQVRPDLTIVSGDITQRAYGHEFAKAKRYFDALAIRDFLIIPGNHDIPLYNPIKRLFFPYFNYSQAFGKVLEPVYQTDHLLVVGIKTTRRYRHKDGEISKAQIERSAQILSHAPPDQLKIIVTHHPLSVDRHQDEKDLLHGGEAALPYWADAGADLVLGGHIHWPFILALHGKFSHLKRRLWLIQAGTAVSSRIRHHADNSINILYYDKAAPVRHCRVERWDYKPVPSQFVQVFDRNLILQAD